MALVHILKNGELTPEDLRNALKNGKRNLAIMIGIFVVIFAIGTIFGPFDDSKESEILGDIIFLPSMIAILYLYCDAFVSLESRSKACKALASVDKGIYTSVDDLVFNMDVSPRLAKMVINGDLDFLKSEKTYQKYFEN